MKTYRSTHGIGMLPGLTLVELSIVLFAILLFLGMIFIGVRAWKQGSDRAKCVLNIRHMQMAVRGFANSNGLNPGADTGILSPPVALASEIIGPGSYLSSAPVCPGQGVYTMGGNVVPQIGTLYMTCSLAAADGHAPDEFSSW